MRILPLTGFGRSGSTLLLNVLDQNPIFKCGDDSEIGNLLYNCAIFVQNNIHHFQLNNREVEKCLINFCNSGTNSWVDTICPQEKIFIDKSRHWTKFLDLYFKIIKDTKVIFTIRDLRGIVNSFEKIRCNSIYYNKDKEKHNVGNDSTILQRSIDSLSINWIEDAILASKFIKETNFLNKENIYFCRYEDLIKNPKEELDKIYEFLDLPKFEHDFNNIEQKPYNDNPYQPWGDHKIKNKIEYQDPKYDFLDKETENFILKNYRWFYEIFYPEVI
jgi:sulfotransferase